MIRRLLLVYRVCAVTVLVALDVSKHKRNSMSGHRLVCAWNKGAPCARSSLKQYGLLLQKTGEEQPLLPYWLTHGTLDSSVKEFINSMCIVAKVRPTRFQEKKLGVKSKLYFGANYVTDAICLWIWAHH